MADIPKSISKEPKSVISAKVAPIELEDHKSTTFASRRHGETSVYKALISLRISLLLGGLIFKKEFSKTGIKRHLTLSRVYSFVVLIFISFNTLRWTTMFQSNDKFGAHLLMKILILIFCLQSLTHFITFTIASEFYERLPDFFLKWENIRSKCSQTLISLSLLSNRSSGIIWIIALSQAGICTYLTFFTDSLDMELVPWDENFEYALLIRIINVIQNFYLIISWACSSALIFIISIALAREFNQISRSIKKFSSAERVELGANFEGIRQHHQRLCNLVVHADDILSMQIACGLSGCMFTSCLMIYFTIYDDTVYANWGLALAMKIFWIVAPLGKVIVDCVSGAILNGAVSIQDLVSHIKKIYDANSSYFISQAHYKIIIYLQLLRQHTLR